MTFFPNFPITPVAPGAAPDMHSVARQVHEQGEILQSLVERQKVLTDLVDGAGAVAPDRAGIFHGYIGVLVVAFLVSLLATPLMRRLAVANGIIDRPSEARKVHRIPVAYLGGAAVYLGIMAGILFSYTSSLHGLINFHPTQHIGEGFLPGGVPLSILLGITVVMLTGLVDDVVKISPRIKIAGQLIAAAALAMEDVGVKLAAQIMAPLGQLVGNPGLVYTLPGGVELDLIYWTGTALIALFVLGACNASNLIDGLDGLLTGVTVIANAGILFIALTLAAVDDGPIDSARVVLCMTVVGACLGFLPHNFNPASIFLGDCGSMLLGYCTIVAIFTLGDTGRTNLVLAGLVIYAVPIIDTTLAIVRRRMAGKSISAADDQHLHHMLKRALGVRGAVFAIYGISAGFAILGVALSFERGRLTYAMVMIFAAFIGVTAFKVARRDLIEREAAACDTKTIKPAPGRGPGGGGGGGGGAKAVLPTLGSASLVPVPDPGKAPESAAVR